MFDNGCEQVGEYIIEEEIIDPETEEDETQILQKAKWIAGEISILHKIEINMTDS